MSDLRFEPQGEPPSDLDDEGYISVRIDPEELERWLNKIGMTGEGLNTLNTLVEQGRAAKAQGFYLEAISVRMYLLEYWLRNLIVLHTGRPFETGGTCGRLIERAADCHLAPELMDRIRRFGRDRNEAIHRLLQGRTSYDSLADVFLEDESLPWDLQDWVVAAYPGGYELPSDPSKTVSGQSDS